MDVGLRLTGSQLLSADAVKRRPRHVVVVVVFHVSGHIQGLSGCEAAGVFRQGQRSIIRVGDWRFLVSDNSRVAGVVVAVVAATATVRGSRGSLPYDLLNLLVGRLQLVYPHGIHS